MAVYDGEVVRLADKVILLLGATPEQAKRSLEQGGYTNALLEKAASELRITFLDRARHIYVMGAVRNRITAILRRRTHTATKPGLTKRDPTTRKTRIEHTLPPGDRD